MSNSDQHQVRVRKAASPPKKGGAQTQNQIMIQNAYNQGTSSNQNTSQSNNREGGQQAPMAAQATQMLLKRQLTFTQEQLAELQRAGRFGKQPVPQEYAVIPPQAPEFRGRKTLVLDLDETLIHSKFSEAHLRACRTRGRCDFQMRIVVEGRPIQVYVLIRPGVLFFLQKLASIYEIVLYTASMSIYANPLVDTLDQDQLIPMRLYREHCFSFQGSYIKDLSLLGRDMKDVIIVDNSPNAYFFHNENAVPILSWYDDPDDRCLFEMIPLLEALSQVHDVRPVIPKFVRKDINLVDFPKAAWVLNDAYRQMHTINEKEPRNATNSSNTDQAEQQALKGSKKVLSPNKQTSKDTQQQTPKKGEKSGTNPKLEDAYERKPSPINLKPLSPRQAKLSSQAEGPSDGKVLSSRQERTFSPRQIKISSKQDSTSDSAAPPQAQQETTNSNTSNTQEQAAVARVSKKTSSGSDKDHLNQDIDSNQQQQQARTRDSRGKSQNAVSHARSQFSPQQKDQSSTVQEDEVAIDQVQRKSRRKVSHQMKQTESSDLDNGTMNGTKRQPAANGRQPTQEALDAGLAAEQNNNNQLYQKVSQRKQIVQRTGEPQPQQQLNIRRKPSANQSNSNGADQNDASRLSSPQQNNGSGSNSGNTSFSQSRANNVHLEINTNKADLGSAGQIVDLPPHLQKIMQARSTTNKTSSMARQAIVIPQGNIITPVNAKLVNSHRIGTSNGVAKDGTGLNQTFQNIPKSNNLFQTSPTDMQQSELQTENPSSKRLHGNQTGKQSSTTGGAATENLNRSFSNQGGVTNGTLSTANANPIMAGPNANQSSASWASRQQVIGMSKSGAGVHGRDNSQNGVIQHSSRLNGRRKLSRNEQAQSSSQTPGATSQINVQGNLSIRRGITRYQQANSHSRAHEQNVSGVMSSRNESQQQQSHQGGTVKLIGKNSLHMKRRSEYPQEAQNSQQWHLPDAKGGNQGIITSESQKNTAQAAGFNFQKHQQANPSAAWGPSNGSSSGQVAHSQSQGGVSQSSHNPKRVINQSVGQLTNVKHINSAQLANVPASSGHKKVQSLLSNLQQRDQGSATAGRQIHLIQQPGVGNTAPGHSAANMIGSQSSSTRHRKPPMLVRTTNNPPRMGGAGQPIPGSQPNSTQNRNRSRDQWINFANIMHQNPGANGTDGGQLTPMGNMGHHKLSSDFIVKNGGPSTGAPAVASTASPQGSKQGFLGLMQTQPISGSMVTKAKFKNAKPLANTRGKSVPQERPSNSQGQGNNPGGQNLQGMHGATGAAYGVSQANSATKSSTGIRISSQRQQFISSSNKTIKTLKQFGQGGRQQTQTANHPNN